MNIHVFLLVFFLIFSSFAAWCPFLAPSWSCPVESSSQGAHDVPTSAQASLSTRLPRLSSRLHCLVGWRISTCTCAPLARGEKPSGSPQASEYRRLRLSQPAVRVLRHHRRFHSCAGWRWQARPDRAHPDLSLSGLPLHIHFKAEHALVSSENPLAADRPGALCPG